MKAADEHGLGDVDAILVQMIESGEAERPWHDAEAVAVRAIVALSRAGQGAAARGLMADLLQGR